MACALRIIIIRLDWCHIHPPFLHSLPFRRSVDRHEPGHSFRLAYGSKETAQFNANQRLPHSPSPSPSPAIASWTSLPHSPPFPSLRPSHKHIISACSPSLLPLTFTNTNIKNCIPILRTPYGASSYSIPPALIIDRFAILKPSIQRLLPAT